MFPPEPTTLPADARIPVPQPPVHHIPPLTFGVLATVLAALAMLGPFCVDAYLPAFPADPVEFESLAARGPANTVDLHAGVCRHGAVARRAVGRVRAAQCHPGRTGRVCAGHLRLCRLAFGPLLMDFPDLAGRVGRRRGGGGARDHPRPVCRCPRGALAVAGDDDLFDCASHRPDRRRLDRHVLRLARDLPVVVRLHDRTGLVLLQAVAGNAAAGKTPAFQSTLRGAQLQDDLRLLPVPHDGSASSPSILAACSCTFRPRP